MSCLIEDTTRQKRDEYGIDWWWLRSPHIEITKVILFNKYSKKLRIKIFDATQAQADYFNFLRSSSENSTEKFLNIGNKILLLRKEILNLWNEIINLNPFCDEIEQDFIMYLGD